MRVKAEGVFVAHQITWRPKLSTSSNVLATTKITVLKLTFGLWVFFCTILLRVTHRSIPTTWIETMITSSKLITALVQTARGRWRAGRQFQMKRETWLLGSWSQTESRGWIWLRSNNTHFLLARRTAYQRLYYLKPCLIQCLTHRCLRISSQAWG